MLQLSAATLQQQIRHCNDFRNAGRLLSVQGVITASLHAGLGELCDIYRDDRTRVRAEVIGIQNQICQLMPLVNASGLKAGNRVVALDRSQTLPVGPRMLGRIVDAFGHPLDGRGPLKSSHWVPHACPTPNPMDRPPIREPIATGQKAIDSLLTIGRGQRIGLFAGSGIGKSTLLGEIAKYSSEDINVVALVGERGRELRPFIEEALGTDGLARSIVVVATVEQPALTRIRAAQTALAIANWFRGRGANVLFMLDSLTRLATAQRELGLLLNEPPTSRGYPPSAMNLMSQLVERMGGDTNGAITAILTVLVDGDDVNEPVADAARSILDGHIVLNRQLAELGHFPAIDVSASISRVAFDVTAPPHRQAARAIRQIISTWQNVEDLIRIGNYQPGSSPEIDQAIQLKPVVDRFLQQQPGEFQELPATVEQLQQIAQSWLARREVNA